MRSTQATTQRVIILGALLAAILAGPAAAQAPCLTVDVVRPVVFPNGAEHPGGRLELCDWKAYTPVSRLHRSYVDGRPIQMLMGTRATNERSVDDSDEVYFRLDDAGRLRLVGYARTFEGRSVSVSFQTADRSKNVNRLARVDEQKDDLLIVMARPH